VKVKAALLDVMTAQKGGRGIAVHKRGWAFSATPRTLFLWEIDPVHIAQEAV